MVDKAAKMEKKVAFRHHDGSLLASEAAGASVEVFRRLLSINLSETEVAQVERLMSETSCQLEHAARKVSTVMCR